MIMKNDKLKILKSIAHQCNCLVSNESESAKKIVQSNSCKFGLSSDISTIKTGHLDDRDQAFEIVQYIY